jgi:hypothetical protein
MDGLPPAARLVGIGFYVALAIVLPTLGGRELDQALGTGVAFTLVGLCLGLLLAIWGGIQQLLEVVNAINARKAEGKKKE